VDRAAIATVADHGSGARTSGDLPALLGDHRAHPRLSVEEQSYIEDCPVCCKPVAVYYMAVDGEVAEFSVESAD